MKTQIYVVTGHYIDESETMEQMFYRLPEGYNGDCTEFPFDDQVSFYLANEEPLVVGSTYGDFVVTGYETI
jgi:formylmethanofuran dehydrogenase subunit D